MRDAFPLAYHITFGTYGTRLHGDERGTVDRRMNRPGDPVIGRADDWQRLEHGRLIFPPREFSLDDMVLVERLIPEICARGGWPFHTCAAGPDHVHTVLSAQADAEAVRKWLKRWLGQSLAGHIPLLEGQTFWAECGSVKWIWTQDYLARAVDYVASQRAPKRSVRT